MKKDRLLFTVCSIMFFQFGFLVITGLVEHHPLPSLHAFLGIAFTISASIHLLLHWRWILGALQKYDRMPVSVRTNLLLDLLLLGSYLACGLTGLLASAVPFGRLSLPHQLAVAGVVLVQAIHIARHWKWIRAACQRSFLHIGPAAAE